MTSKRQMLGELLKEGNTIERGKFSGQLDRLYKQHNDVRVSRYGFCSEDALGKYCQVSNAVESNGSAP